MNRGGSALYEDDIESVLISEDQVQTKVAELAAVVSKDYEGARSGSVEPVTWPGARVERRGELLTWAPAAG